MANQFDYRVCAMQNNRITFVNGEWQGEIGPEGVEPAAALETCPAVWVYLQGVGAEGWELTGSLDQAVEGTRMQTLFLKRLIGDDG